MNGFSNTIQLVILCAIIFIPVGFVLHRHLLHWLRIWQNMLFSPRYLKSAGLWVREGSTSQIKRKKP